MYLHHWKSQMSCYKKLQEIYTNFSMNRKCHVIGTINLINALRHYLHFYPKELVMCPAHV